MTNTVISITIVIPLRYGISGLWGKKSHAQPKAKSTAAAQRESSSSHITNVTSDPSSGATLSVNHATSSASDDKVCNFGKCLNESDLDQVWLLTSRGEFNSEIFP